ncbi:MAG: hypothetical protein PSY12_06810 [bacterium]|nr:hypothetical protein [bacterium]
MAFVARWLLVIAICFLVFPIVFVLWHGPDAQLGYAGGMMMMLFVQFISPFGLWKIPIGVGTILALGWQAVLRLKSS